MPINHRSAHGPVRVSEILAKTSVEAARAGGVAVDQHTWRRLVGERVAARTSPKSLKRGTLYIETASAVWAQELSLLSSDILQRLQSHGLAVDALRFRVAAAREPRPAERRPPIQDDVPAPIPETLSRTLGSLDDPELARLIADTAVRTIARQQRLANAVPTTSTQPDARGPRCAETETSPQDQASLARNAKSPRTRGGSAG